MAKLIIVTGFLATLKTTISSRLSQDLGVVCFNKDIIKEILGDSIGFSNREDNLKLSKATFHLIQFLAKKELTLGNDVIIESNFKPHELKALENQLNLNDSNTMSLFLDGDVKVLYQRYLDRQPMRHSVHCSTGLMSFEIFKASMEQYKKQDCIGHLIESDTTDFNDLEYKRLLGEIKSFLKLNN